jgi:hypothetical protein
MREWNLRSYERLDPTSFAAFFLAGAFFLALLFLAVAFFFGIPSSLNSQLPSGDVPHPHLTTTTVFPFIRAS